MELVRGFFVMELGTVTTTTPVRPVNFRFLIDFRKESNLNEYHLPLGDGARFYYICLFSNNTRYVYTSVDK